MPRYSFVSSHGQETFSDRRLAVVAAAAGGLSRGMLATCGTALSRLAWPPTWLAPPVQCAGMVFLIMLNNYQCSL